MARWDQGVWDQSYWSAVVGYMAATETGTDTFSATGINIDSGNLAATETGTDVFAATGSVSTTGYMAATETGTDTFAATGSVSLAGYMAATETGTDVFAATGSVSTAGYMAATETGVDNFFATGTVSATGYMAAIETGEDVFAATGTVTPVPVPNPVIADIGPGDEKQRKNAQKKRDEAFEREKQEREALRQQIKRTIDPVVEQAKPVVVSEGKRSVQVLSVDGSRIGIAVPPAFDVAEVGRIVAEVLESAQIEARRVQKRKDAELALAQARAQLARIVKRKMEDEFLLLMD